MQPSLPGLKSYAALLTWAQVLHSPHDLGYVPGLCCSLLFHCCHNLWWLGFNLIDFTEQTVLEWCNSSMAVCRIESSVRAASVSSGRESTDYQSPTQNECGGKTLRRKQMSFSDSTQFVNRWRETEGCRRVNNRYWEQQIQTARSEVCEKQKEALLIIAEVTASHNVSLLLCTLITWYYQRAWQYYNINVKH